MIDSKKEIPEFYSSANNLKDSQIDASLNNFY